MAQDNQQAVWDETYTYRKRHYPRLVSEGDSWFCYPMWRSMMDFVSESNGFAICRRGESGRRLQQIVDDRKYLKAVTSEKPKALLISGSGNDFVNHDFVTGGDGRGPMFNRFVVGMEPHDVINATKWDAKLSELGDYFDTIVKQVDDLPVLVHGYAYILPSGKPAAYDGLHVAGPWIRPTLIDQKVPETMHREVVMLMIDSLNHMMASVANTHPTFVYVDVRPAVVDDDWANEIHPYESGFRKIAAKYLAALNKVLANPPVPVIALGGNP